MKKQKKRLLIAAGVLVLAGAVIFSAAMTVIHWDFSKLSTVEYKTESFEIKENFDSVTVETDNSDIVFALSEDGICRVNFNTSESTVNNASVFENTLTINSSRDSKKWYENISINARTPSITVYLPENKCKSLKVKAEASDVEIQQSLAFDEIDASVQNGEIKINACVVDKIKTETDTGDIELTDIECSSAQIKSNTGRICMKAVVSENKISAENKTGDIEIYDSDAAEIKLNSSTGNISGSFLSDKIFAVQSDCGTVDVPESFTGGKCEITTDSGDVKFIKR